MFARTLVESLLSCRDIHVLYGHIFSLCFNVIFCHTDANANEAVIEELKNAIALQEETMEEQDRYIQQKEERISKLQQGS